MDKRSEILSLDRAAALAFLYGRINYERAPSVPDRWRALKLDRMRHLLQRLGNPHQQLRVIHIAGTKGKGSTAAMIGSVLSQAGYRTALYTSPHLHRLEERMTIDGMPCSPAELVALTDRLRLAVAEMDRQEESGPTFFEITTAMAMLHFAQRQVDLAVLEVGLGGRLDSTNVCHPLVSVITSISLDHTRQLGSTLGRIAREKAGIIKRGTPVVSGVSDGEALREIERVAAQKHAPLATLQRDFGYSYHSVPIIGNGCCGPPSQPNMDYHASAGRGLSNLALGLLGDHQAANAAVALATLDWLKSLGWPTSEQAVRDGLAGTRCPARIEMIARRPLVVIDAAHNVASVTALIKVLEESFAAQRRILVFSTSQDKDAGGMLSCLIPQFDEIILTRYQNNPRSVDPLELARLAAGRQAGAAAKLARIQIEPDPRAAWQRAIELASDECLVCVTGSFFLAAEIRSLAADSLSPSVPLTLEPVPRP